MNKLIREIIYFKNKLPQKAEMAKINADCYFLYIGYEEVSVIVSALPSTLYHYRSNLSYMNTIQQFLPPTL